MASGRYRQKPFFHARNAKCWICGHVAVYYVVAEKGRRLRDQICKCGAMLGRGTHARAAPIVKARAQVERLARKMKFPFTTP
jgi:hypothetical protein